jgi:hypothetical protein
LLLLLNLRLESRTKSRSKLTLSLRLLKRTLANRSLLITLVKTKSCKLTLTLITKLHINYKFKHFLMSTFWFIRRGNFMLRILGMPGVNPLLHDIPKMGDQTLDRPGSSISQGTNRVTFNLLSQLPKHVNLCIRSISFFQPLQKSNQPISSFSTRSALTARLMSIKLGKSQNCLYWIDLSVHNNNSSSS